MRLVILGGGGFRVPHVYSALLADRDHDIDEVILYDTDVDRLMPMRELLEQIPGGGTRPKITIASDLDTAVTGVDFVFSAIRVGGLPGRIHDERVALDLGVLGQETTGPGGLAYALRTIPVMLHIAERIRELSPNAFTINFTNPAGIITESLQSVLGDRVVGICDTPIGLGRRVAERIGVEPSALELDYVGLNHLGWMRRILLDGHDILPDLLASDQLADFEEASLFGLDWMRTLGAIPNEYLYYYYFTRDAVAAIRASDQTRGEYLDSQQGDFFRKLSETDDKIGLWTRTVNARSGSYMAEVGATHSHSHDDEPEDDGYAGVAVSVMRALSRGDEATMILNVRNNGAVAGMPDDAVVEVPARVSTAGVQALPTTPLSLHQLGLMQQVKSVERDIIAAACTGDRRSALRGFAMHPLVDSVTIAEKLLAQYDPSEPRVPLATT